MRKYFDTIRKIPNTPCLGYKTEYYGWGSDFDCGYNTLGDLICEDCLCNKEIGGRRNPRIPNYSDNHFDYPDIKQKIYKQHKKIKEEFGG